MRHLTMYSQNSKLDNDEVHIPSKICLGSCNALGAEDFTSNYLQLKI